MWLSIVCVCLMGLIGWKSLKVPPSELRLHCTLQTGQSFRWWQTSKEVYTGVIGTRVFQLRQTPDMILYRYLLIFSSFTKTTVRRLNEIKESVVELSDERILNEYFNLEECRMADLVLNWSQKDTRFGSVAPFLSGARVLRQEPLECLFQFICSSNNHIIRIQVTASLLSLDNRFHREWLKLCVSPMETYSGHWSHLI